MKSQDQFSKTLQLLDEIVLRLGSEKDVQEIRRQLSEFQDIFNGCCKKELAKYHGDPCYGENGCKCRLFRNAIAKGWLKIISSSERSSNYDVKLGPF